MNVPRHSSAPIPRPSGRPRREPAAAESGQAEGVRGRFRSSARLLRHADFQRVYKQGRRHFGTHMTVFYLQRPEVGPAAGPRIGFTVSRALGGAVHRNRIKRRLREAVRGALPQLTVAADVVINPKKSAETADFSGLRSEVARAFAVVQEKLERQ